MTAIYILSKLQNKPVQTISEYTVLGALARYITTENKDFEPMNANFGILPPLDRIVKDKAQRKRLMAERSIEQTTKFKEMIR